MTGAARRSFVVTMLWCYIILAAASTNAAAADAEEAPVVDLGYTLHMATLNDTAQYFNFSNIRYAAPPLGNLRFAKPVAPSTNRSVIDNGQTGHICPQAQGYWTKEAQAFLLSYFMGGNITAFKNASPPGTGLTVEQVNIVDPRMSEDCLFLDVIAPTTVYNARKNGSSGAPVLVWVYGGGFTTGMKEVNPVGFFKHSRDLVFVSINYRLGAFGWLSGPSFQEEGTANAGLYDQAFAFEWVRRNIHRFGGDPERVTVMGSSAGASSILHHLTAYGGHGRRAPFQQAILQSPAFSPTYGQVTQELRYQRFLNLANVSSMAELRDADSETLMAANRQQVFEQPYGARGFGPTVDGDYVPSLPGLLLLHGQVAPGVRRVFVGHNSNEGYTFVDPAAQNKTAALQLTRQTLPQAGGLVLKRIEQLYPRDFNNATLGYHDDISRLARLVNDAIISCNTQYVLKAFGTDTTHSYFFNEGLGLHGEQTAYTFYDGQPTQDTYRFGTVASEVAEVLQGYIVDFVGTGSPSGSSMSFPTYGSEQKVAVLKGSKASIGVDPLDREKCEFWQKALYA